MTDLECTACNQVTHDVFRFKANGCEIWQCERCGLGRAETSGFDPNTSYTAGLFFRSVRRWLFGLSRCRAGTAPGICA